MRALRGLVCLLCALALGCEGGDLTLLVRVQTDARPGYGFRGVRTVVTDASGAEVLRETRPAMAEDDYLAGLTVAEARGLSPGAHRVRVDLLDRAGAPVVGRNASVELRAVTSITVPLTLDCRDVRCPLASDSPALTECLGGRCVQPGCVVEDSAVCGEAECATDFDCASEIACAAGVCREGICFGRPDDTACRANQFCDPEEGCRPRDDGAGDGGVEDAAVSDAGGGCVPGGGCDTGRACERGVVQCVEGAAVCVADGPLDTGTSCRPAAGACDVPETCDGASPLCPPDAFAEVGARCDAGVCDGLGGCAPCTPGAPCSTGEPCERGLIVCAGASATCAVAGPAAAGIVCREASDLCDAAEVCDGASTACPADVFRPSTTTCRESIGDCDVAERCTGASASCPADALRDATTVCRAADGDCDEAERCTGGSASCPGDAFATGGTCRPSAGACDLAESCDGSGPDCPPDARRSSAYVCRAGDGVCDPEERCAGGTGCGPDIIAVDETPCGGTWEELGCGPHSAEWCQGGACVPSPGFDASGAPTCGTIANLCGFSPGNCCGAGGRFCAAEAGNDIFGSASDCNQCCRPGRCCVDGDPEGDCI